MLSTRRAPPFFHVEFEQVCSCTKHSIQQTRLPPRHQTENRRQKHSLLTHSAKDILVRTRTWNAQRAVVHTENSKIRDKHTFNHDIGLMNKRTILRSLQSLSAGLLRCLDTFRWACCPAAAAADAWLGSRLHMLVLQKELQTSATRPGWELHVCSRLARSFLVLAAPVHSAFGWPMRLPFASRLIRHLQKTYMDAFFSVGPPFLLSCFT